MSHQEARSNGASASASRKTAESMEAKELGALCNDLDVCAADWRALGTALRLKKATLKAIQGVTSPVRNCFTRILETWLETASPTKTQLLKALRSASVGQEEKVAKKLEDSDLPETLEEDHLFDLMGILDSVMHKYSALALQLGISNATVKEIERPANRGVREYLRDMLAEWLAQSKGPASEQYQALIDAVGKPPISNQRLAGSLREKWSAKLSKTNGKVDIN